MTTKGETQHIWKKALKIATEERDFFLKSLKVMSPEFRKRTHGVTFRFDERPSKVMLKRGIVAETLSLTERDDKVVVLFLMNLSDRYGKCPGDFRKELRRVMCQELADLAGMEWTGEE